MLIRQLVEFMTPVSCLGCGHEGAYLCVDCLSNQPIRASTCYRCNRLTEHHHTCQACRRNSSLHGVYVGAYYDGIVKAAILKLKFNRSAAAADSLAQLLVRIIGNNDRFDSVTAVPVSPHRQRERGYNQSELIARRLANQLALPYHPLLLRTSSGHQLGSSRADRFAQVRGVFRPIRAIERQRILLVDDVLTTGATAEAAARVLRQAGASSVHAAVAARHRA